MILVRVHDKGMTYQTNVFSMENGAHVVNDDGVVLVNPTDEANYICSKLNTNSIITITKLLIFIWNRYGVKREGILERV